MTGFMAPPLKAESKFLVLTRMPMGVCPFCELAADWPSDIVVVYTEELISVVPLISWSAFPAVWNSASTRTRRWGSSAASGIVDADFRSREPRRGSPRKPWSSPSATPTAAPSRCSTASISLRPGRLTAVVGASGSGKSTLLNALGPLPPKAGRVMFDGTTSRARRRPTRPLAARSHRPRLPEFSPDRGTESARQCHGCGVVRPAVRWKLAAAPIAA